MCGGAESIFVSKEWLKPFFGDKIFIMTFLIFSGQKSSEEFLL